MAMITVRIPGCIEKDAEGLEFFVNMMVTKLAINSHKSRGKYDLFSFDGDIETEMAEARGATTQPERMWEYADVANQAYLAFDYVRQLSKHDYEHEADKDTL